MLLLLMSFLPLSDMSQHSGLLCSILLPCLNYSFEHDGIRCKPGNIQLQSFRAWKDGQMTSKLTVHSVDIQHRHASNYTIPYHLYWHIYTHTYIQYIQYI